MIRFRLTEDERRYMQLLSEAYRLLASGLPPQNTSRVLRNLGKLEQMSYLEGVRQGLALAELSYLGEESGRQNVRNMRAFQAHAILYGSTDTPLRDAEMEWLRKMGLPPDTAAEAWLDAQPMRYAPQTLQEWEGQPVPEATPRPHFSTLEELDPALVSHVQSFEPPQPASTLPSEELLSDAVFDTDESADVQEAPAFLDQLRDTLSNLRPPPTTWEDLILQTHLVTGADAGYLDLQLSTPMGLTLLAQCGMPDIKPGFQINLQDLPDRPVVDPTSDGSSSAGDPQ